MTLYRDAVAASSPLSYWRLGETSGTTRADAAGSSSLTINGSPTLGVAGALGAMDSNPAGRYDGSNDYDRLPSGAASFNFTGTASFTVEFLIKPRVTPAGFPKLVSKATFTTVDLGWYVALANNNRPYIARFDAAGANDLKQKATALTNGVWTHLVFTYSSTNGLILYVNGSADGSPVASTRSISSEVTNTGLLTLGAYSDGTSNFDGDLDEVAIYNTELSSATVAAHWAAFLEQVIALAGQTSAERVGGLIPAPVPQLPPGFAPLGGGAFGQYAAFPLATTLALAGIGSAAEPGALTATPGAVTLAPLGLSSAERGGVSSAAQALAPAGLATAEQGGLQAITHSLALAAVGSDERAGAIAAGLNLALAGAVSSEQQGATAASPVIQASGVATGELPGAAQATPAIALTAVAGAEQFGAAVLAVGPPVLALAGLDSSERAGAEALVPGPVTLAPAALAPAELAGAPGFAAGDKALTLTGIESTGDLGAAAMVPGPVSLALAGLESAGLFGDAAATPGAVALALLGALSAEQPGAGVLAAGPPMLSLAGIASGERAGAGAAVPGSVSLVMVGLLTGGQAGASTAAPGGVTLTLVGVLSTEQGGSAVWIISALLPPGSLPLGGAAFGQYAAFPPAIAPVGQVLTLVGIGQSELLGIPVTAISTITFDVGGSVILIVYEAFASPLQTSYQTASDPLTTVSYEANSGALR